MMLERQWEGIANAKTEDKYKGCKPTGRAKADQVIKLREAGVKPSEIVDQLCISRASVYRILSD
jgi:DNA invertase Pin-like site-specific DNA recombinase